MVASPHHPRPEQTAGEREFYLRLAIRERWSKRELERQFKTALFERAVLHPPKVTPAVTQRYPEALSIFRDASERLPLPFAGWARWSEPLGFLLRDAVRVGPSPAEMATERVA
jgi:hypothetical protein